MRHVGNSLSSRIGLLDHELILMSQSHISFHLAYVVAPVLMGYQVFSLAFWPWSFRMMVLRESDFANESEVLFSS